MQKKQRFACYAVRKGRKPGIFLSWFGHGQAHEQIENFPKAEFKGFYSRPEAQAWLFNSDAVLKQYDKLVDRLVKGDQTVLPEAVALGNQLKAPWDNENLPF